MVDLQERRMLELLKVNNNIMKIYITHSTDPKKLYHELFTLISKISCDELFLKLLEMHNIFKENPYDSKYIIDIFINNHSDQLYNLVRTNLDQFKNIKSYIKNYFKSTGRGDYVLERLKYW